jgi:enoyl-CoA hydratase/carnithine racemase
VADFETITYTADDNGVAWVTLNRPEVHNAFNLVMQHELRTVWRWLRRDDDVRAVVVTGAGDKAFCTGVDRQETFDRDEGGGKTDGETGGEATGPDPGNPEPAHLGYVGGTRFMFDDPGEYLGPKSNDLWKPVIAAVNGMACGGAFYLLGEVEFIIASEDATFFDPHVTYGMPAAYEPMQMLSKMPFPEIMRMSLLGADERMSAKRAHEIGLVTEVCPREELRERAAWAARAIADSPPLVIQGTMRALWTGLEVSRSQAIELASLYIRIGTTSESLKAGQKRFESGQRPKWRLR